MTKAQIIEKVSEQVTTLTKRQAEIVVNTIFNSIRDSLQRGDKTEIRGFGSFRSRARRMKEGSAVSEVIWTDEALKRMERAPVFLRGMVKRLAEKKARELGYREITAEILDQFKNQMMGRMGGEAGLTAAAGQIVKGRIPWTAAAQERLETVPEFMRPMIKQIAVPRRLSPATR